MKKIIVPTPEYCPYRDDDYARCLFFNLPCCENEDCFPEGCLLEDDS